MIKLMIARLIEFEKQSTKKLPPRFEAFAT